MTGWLLSVDPGLRGCGCAVWHDGQLVRAGYVTPATPKINAFLGDVVESTTNAVSLWAGGNYAAAVIELPQTYGGRAKRGDANDLIHLALVVGALASRFAPATLVTPHQWKGSTKKEVTAAQVEAKLSVVEYARIIWPKSKKLKLDVYDSIGIGLDYLKR